MGMPHATLRWTPAMVRALPDDGNRYELIDGMLLVTPSPILLHQRAVSLLARTLDDYVVSRGLGEVLTSPADLTLEPETIVQPDVFVAPLVDGALPRQWTDVRGLLLAVEILSPGSRRHDRVTKRAFYARVGVPEYWIVDLDARVVERWKPGGERPELLDERLAWQPAGTDEPLELDLAALFACVHGERPRT
jgi:Uma2 family endonuclease